MFNELAQRESVKVRILLDGPSGAGKTMSALLMAKGLAMGGKVGLIDTQNGQSLYYADQFQFRPLIIRGSFAPEHYITGIRAAEKAGIDVLIIDSASHEWSGRGGILEMVDVIGRRLGGSSSAWKDVTPLHLAFLDEIIQCDMHIIVTCRTKTEWVYESQQKGNRRVTVPRKIGTQLDQRDKFEYEFNLWCRLDEEHRAQISKSTIPGLTVGTEILITEEHGQQLRAWLDTGAPVSEEMRESSRLAREADQRIMADYDRKYSGQGTTAAPQRPPAARTEPKQTDMPLEPPVRPDDDVDPPVEAAEETEPVTTRAAQNIPTSGTVPPTKRRQCDVCGKVMYLGTLESHEGNEFKVDMLVARCMELYGRILCSPHFVAEREKTRRRGGRPVANPA